MPSKVSNSKTASTASATNTNGENMNTTTEFTVLTEAPTFRKSHGRAKTPLRLAMEGLEEGQFLVAATLTGDENKDKNTVGSIRQKAQDIASDPEFGYRYSVRIDTENRVIVARKSNKAA